MPLKQSRGLDGPFTFTSASFAVYARIHAAGNTLPPKLKVLTTYHLFGRVNHIYALSRPRGQLAVPLAADRLEGLGKA
jgi:hypothetical protein